RVDGDTSVAEDGLRPGRSDGDEPARKLRHRVANVPQRAIGLAILDLEIRNHGVHHRIPADQPFIAVNQSFAIELDEYPPDSGGEARIHRKAFAAPIRRGAEATQLVDN